MTITPPAKGHVYDLKTNKYIGNCEASFTVEMPLEGLGAFAVLPYEIKAPELSVSAEENGTINCKVIIRPDEASSNRHAIKLRLFEPNGREWKDFAATTTTDVKGKAEHKFILPLNSPHGTWKIEAREAISGLNDMKTIEIAGQKQ